LCRDPATFNWTPGPKRKADFIGAMECLPVSRLNDGQQLSKGVFSMYISPEFHYTLEEIPMSYNKLTLLPALLCASALFGQGVPKSAHADIVNAQGQKIGAANILPAKEGVTIVVNVSQLPTGTHGVSYSRCRKM
jgi:hypothetical protein